MGFGQISGVIALVIQVFLVGYWFGSFDTRFKEVNKSLEFITKQIFERLERRLELRMHETIPQGSFYSLECSSNILDISEFTVLDNYLSQLFLPESILEVVKVITNENIDLDSVSIANLIIRELVVSNEDDMNGFIENNSITRDEFISLIIKEVKMIQEGSGVEESTRIVR